MNRHRSLPELSAHQAKHASAIDSKIQGQPPAIRRNDGPYLDSTKDRTYSGRLQNQRTSAVATATPPTPFVRYHQARQPGPLAHSPQKQPLDSQSLLISDVCRDPLFDSTLVPSSVDRSSPMTVLKPSRSLKATRRNLVVGLSHTSDTKKSSLSIDNDDHDIFKEIITDNPYDSKRFSPLPPKLRTIRRRKRPGIGRSSSSEGASVKPIAISLTFSSSAVPQSLPTKVSMSALCDRVTYSAETDSESRATFDAPSSPIPAETGSPERRASTTLSTRPSTPLSASLHPASVRLGHPSRPYYSAIRKQGISPPSSRRSSIKDSGVAPIRPISYSPSSPLPPSHSVPGSSPQRHLSLSAVPHTSSLISAFSLDDESDDNIDEELPVIPLTPLPVSGRRSFGTSLTSVAKSLTRKRSSSGPPAASTSTTPKYKHSHSASSPQAVFPLSSTAHLSLPPLHQGNMKGVFRMSTPSTAGSGASGIGFSVSGETELKMALAFSDAQTTKNSTSPISFISASTPAIQEEEDTATGLSPSLLSTTPLSLSPISPPSSLQLPIVSNQRNSIAGRVKKLTRGLKDILLMTTHGAGNNTTSTTTTSTT